jgi:hypothetical protein
MMAVEVLRDERLFYGSSHWPLLVDKLFCHRFLYIEFFFFLLKVVSRLLISAECCTFKLLNLHMLIPQRCYLFDFALFLCFRSNARVSLEIGLKGTSWHHSIAVNDHSCTYEQSHCERSPKACERSHCE